MKYKLKENAPDLKNLAFSKLLLNREVAEIALKAGQIEKLKYSTTRLFSEDLY